MKFTILKHTDVFKTETMKPLPTVAHIRNAQQYLYRSLQSFTVRNSGLQCTITFF